MNGKVSQILKTGNSKVRFITSVNGFGLDVYFFILMNGIDQLKFDSALKSKDTALISEYGKIVVRGVGKIPRPEILKYVSEEYKVDAWQMVQYSGAVQ